MILTIILKINNDFIFLNKKKDIMSDSLKKKVIYFCGKWRREFDDLYFRQKVEKKPVFKAEDKVQKV